jgi:hypothetical protein
LPIEAEGIIMPIAQELQKKREAATKAAKKRADWFASGGESGPMPEVIRDFLGEMEWDMAMAMELMAQA